MKSNLPCGGATTKAENNPFRLLCMFCALCGALFSCVAPAHGKDKIDLLITGGTVVTMDAAKRIVTDGAVAIRADRIVAVGPAADLGRQYQAAKTLPAAGKLVMPGLINGHNHAPMVLFRGLADDMKLSDWLQKYIFPAEAKNASRDFVEAGTALACLEMIRSGTTTYADMYYFEDQVAQVTALAGMRGILGETIIQFPVADNKTPEEALSYTEQFIKRWKGNGLIVPAVAPHAPYTNSAATLQSCKALADKYSVPVLIHVAETQDETTEIRQKYGKTPVGWLEGLGVLGPNVVISHGVWLTEPDLDVVRRKGVGVAHNPESNMKLASGTAPVIRMLALGIPVGLGTDGAASNNDLDMFEAMDITAKLHKLVLVDPAALPAEQVVEMATIGGAAAQHMEKEIGSLEKGKKADVIVIDLNEAHAVPMYNIYSHLVYALKGADVSDSIINGKVVMRNGRVLTLDAARVVARAREMQKKIAESLKN
jgi:5-methylthioadenosine/S-adenosylhomocysteine deaminase